MAVEDALHPFLTSYLNAPQWVKSSVGRCYRLLPTAVRLGWNYDRAIKEAAMQNESALKQLGIKKLGATLHWALKTVPAFQKYRYLLKQAHTPLELLRELPLMSKDAIESNPDHFLSSDMPASRRLKTFTGGSMNSPTMFYLQRGISRTKEYAFIENFHQRNGVSKPSVIFALRGRQVPSARLPGGQLWMVEPIKRELIASTEHLERHDMAEYMRAMRLCKPSYIQAYPSALYPMARWLRDNPAPDLTQRIRGIMLFSENILEHHMRLFKEVFSCPILKHYGQSERVLMAASMPDDERYFFWPQYGHFELVDPIGDPVTEPGELGEIVGTSFDNQVMPFVRYRTGDMAILGDRPHPLLPGYPVVERIEGRLQEFIVCTNQRLVSIDALIQGMGQHGVLSGIQSMQFEQNKPGHCVMKVISCQRLTNDTRSHIQNIIRLNTKDGCSATVIEVDHLPRNALGKQPILIQKLTINWLHSLSNHGWAIQ